MPYKDPKKRVEASKKSRLKKPEYYREKSKESGKRRSKRGYFILRRYGLTLAQFNDLAEKQGGVCAICGELPHGNSPKSSVLHVDHDHTTGKVRGLLCGPCNRVLGIVQKRNILKKIEVYIENNS